MSFWQKLNHLVPEPDCSTRGEEITEWRDVRPQPTNVTINAVSQTAVDARIATEVFDKEVEGFSSAMKAIFDQLEDEIPGFQGRVKIKHDQP